jgi:low temperature requirement protein LtrA
VSLRPTRFEVRPPELRTYDDADTERRATWLELFFDLVFVVTVAQLATKLSKDTSVAGFARFAGLFVPILWAWVGFTFYANRFDTDDAIYRVMKLTAMLGVVALAVNVPSATTDHGSVGFAVSYVSVRLVLEAMYLRARRYVAGGARMLVDRYLLWFGVGAGLWLVSLAVPLPWRFWIWGIALGLELVQPVFAWPSLGGTPINVPHITERYGAFFIIVLGESILGVVARVAGVSFGVHAILVSAASFTVAASLWWIYFDFADTSVIGRGVMGLVYVYGHVPLLIGVATVGVGTKLAIHDAAEGHLTAGTRWALCAGLAAYLLALGIFHLSAEWSSSRDPILLARLAVAAAALVLAALGGPLSPLLFMGLLTCAIVALLVLEASSFPEGAASVYEPAPAGSAPA